MIRGNLDRAEVRGPLPCLEQKHGGGVLTTHCLHVACSSPMPTLFHTRLGSGHVSSKNTAWLAAHTASSPQVLPLSVSSVSG